MFALTAVQPTLPRITSRQHPLVRTFRDLATSGAGAAEILLDGAHLIREAIAAGVRVDAVLVAEDFEATAPAEDAAVVASAADAGAQIYRATPAVLDAATPVRTPTGIVARAAWT